MDNLTAEQRRKNMQNIRSKGTKPERMVMEALKKRRIYFAAYVSKITGKPAEMLKVDIKLYTSRHKSLWQEIIAPMDDGTSLPKF